MSKGLDTLTYRDFADRRTEEEHEHLIFDAIAADIGLAEDPIWVDVFNEEGSLQVVHNTDVEADEFLEAVEAWYPIHAGVETWYKMDEWHEGRPSEVLGAIEEVKALDFYFRDQSFDDFDVYWVDNTDHMKEHHATHTVTMTIYYDNLELLDGSWPLESLEKIYPSLMRSDSSREARYRILSDVMRYAFYQEEGDRTGVPAIDEEVIGHYFERSSPQSNPIERLES